MTLFEWLTTVACLVAAGCFSGDLGSSHHWVLGVVALPLGFFAAAAVFGFLGELAVRRGNSRMGRTPTHVIQRSVPVGCAIGLTAGAAFYLLAARQIIPTPAGGWHRAIVSACLFGTSLALTVMFFLMLRHDRQ